MQDSATDKALQAPPGGGAEPALAGDRPAEAALAKFRTVLANCRARGFLAEAVADAAVARARLAELIPPGADIMTGGSQTLQQIGFMADIYSRRNGWESRRPAILAEDDDDERERLRRGATTADYIVGSVNALTVAGEAVCIDHGGTRVGAYCYGADKVIWVVGKNKLVPTLDAALRRAREHVFPLESARVRKEWNIDSGMFKTLVVEGEHRPGRIRVILVDQELGF